MHARNVGVEGRRDAGPGVGVGGMGGERHDASQVPDNVREAHEATQYVRDFMVAASTSMGISLAMGNPTMSRTEMVFPITQNSTRVRTSDWTRLIQTWFGEDAASYEVVSSSGGQPCIHLRLRRGGSYGSRGTNVRSRTLWIIVAALLIACAVTAWTYGYLGAGASAGAATAMRYAQRATGTNAPPPFTGTNSAGNAANCLPGTTEDLGNGMFGCQVYVDESKGLLEYVSWHPEKHSPEWERSSAASGEKSPASFGTQDVGGGGGGGGADGGAN